MLNELQPDIKLSKDLCDKLKTKKLSKEIQEIGLRINAALMLQIYNYGLYNTWYQIKISNYIPNLDKFDLFYALIEVLTMFVQI